MRSLRTFRMLKNWKSTNVLKAMVPATVAVPASGSTPGASASTNRVPTAMITDENATAVQRCLVRIFSSIGRGLRFMMSESAWSRPSAIAGGPSMMMFTHRIAMAAKGLPLAMPKMDAARNNMAKPSVVLSWNRTNLTMLS